MIKYYLINHFIFIFIYSNFYESKYFCKFDGETILITNSFSMEHQYLRILQKNVELMEEVILYSSTTLTIYEKRQRD